MENTKQVIFKLGNEEFGIGIVYVKAIERYMDIVPVPNAPSFIEGKYIRFIIYNLASENSNKKSINYLKKMCVYLGKYY